MSKIIKSPVDRWPGTVTLADPLSYPQAIGYEDAQIAVNAMLAKKARDTKEGKETKRVTARRLNRLLMPAILECVEEFNLGNHDDWTLGGFPASPGDDASELFNWIFNEVIKVANGEEEDPKKE